MATTTYSFNNVVSEFVVNQTTVNDQFRPDVVMQNDGSMFFTFDTDSAAPNQAFQDVLFRRFNANGTAINGTDQVITAGIGSDDEEDSAVSVLSNGNVVVVNEDNDSGADDDVEFHIRSSTGGVIDINNIVPAEGQGGDNQSDPEVAALTGGGFVVVYVDQFAGSATNMNAEFIIYNNNGTVRAGPTIAGGALTSQGVLHPAVTALTNGNFVVTWREDIDGTAGVDLNIKARIYNENGAPVSAEIPINVDPDNQAQPTVVATPGGGFAIAYTDEVGGSATDTELEVKFVNAAGTQVGPTQFINSGTDFISDADIEVISANHVLVSYTSNRNGNDDIFARVYEIAGNHNQVGSEFNLEVTAGAQNASALSSNGGGRFVSTWQDGVAAGLDASGFHVAAQVTELRRTITSDNTGEILIGDELRDTLIGNGGDDFLDGREGIDTTNGGLGDDFHFVDNGLDVVIEAAGQGTLDRLFSAATVYTLANGVEIERMSTQDNLGVGAQDLIGNNIANTIYGNNGINILDGRGGADTMAGLGGVDFYYVDNLGDTVSEAAGGGYDRVFSSVSWNLNAGAELEVISTTNNLGVGVINFRGNEQANLIYGNAGQNIIGGQGGNDKIYGFGGQDYFLFEIAPNTATNVDVLADFGLDDTILLLGGAYPGLPAGVLAAGAFRVGGGASDADDRIIYENITGRLFFDVDGTGAAAQVQFATVSTVPALTNADFVVV